MLKYRHAGSDLRLLSAGLPLHVHLNWLTTPAEIHDEPLL